MPVREAPTQIIRDSRPAQAPRPTTDPPIFACGEIVAERFEILRFLGQGGMGQVFEARDLELDVRVALKVIRPGIARRRRAVDRFKCEVQLARQVTHPNVCRIFDLYSHRPRESVAWGASTKPVLFLTMEMLRGETLEAHLARHGPLSPEEALALITQMADALDAAHRVGVVHRDFKSANVMLVGTDEDRRAVVTDFGLSQTSARAGGDMSPETGRRRRSGNPPGSLRGTPAYLAPELMEGRTATPAADVYAFGVVIRELLTGFPAPPAGAGEEKARRRREPDRRSLEHSRTELPAHWDPVVSRCLDRRPERRFPRAGDAAAALGSADRRRRRPRLVRPVLAVPALVSMVLLSSLAMAGLDLLPETGASPAPAASLSPVIRPTLAVLGFHDLSDGSQATWISTALPEMLTAELAADERLRVVSGQRVSRMNWALDLPDLARADTERLSRVSEYLESDFVVVGTYDARSPDIRLDLRLLKTPEAEVVAQWTQTLPRAELSESGKRIARRLRRALGLGAEPRPPGGVVEPGLPTRPRATRTYVEGLSALRRFDYAEAQQLLEQASALEPRAPTIHAALTEALDGQGFEKLALESARRAFELGGHLPREERYLLEGRYYELGRQWARAQEIYRALWTLFPDNIEAGLRLMAVETVIAPEQALATAAELRDRHTAPTGGGIRLTETAVRIHLAEAEAARARADHERQLRAAGRAVEVAEAMGADLMTAQARLLEAEALGVLGRPAEAEAALAIAFETFQARGDLRSMAWALVNTPHRYQAIPGLEKRMTLEDGVDVFRQIGDRRGEAMALARLGRRRMGHSPQAAQEDLERSLALAREIGDPRAVAEALNGLAILAYVYERVRESYDRFEEAVEAARRSGNLRLRAGTLQNLASIAKMLGDPDHARELFEEAIAIGRRIGDRRVLALTLTNSAHLIDARSDHASQQCAEALELGREIEDPIQEARGLVCLGRIARMEKRYGEARRLYEEAIGIWETLGDTLAADVRKLDVCRIRIDASQLREAAECVRKILDRRPLASGDHLSIHAQIQLARIALREEDFDEAHRLSQEALPWLSFKDEPNLRNEGTRVIAKAENAAGRGGDSVRAFRILLAQATAAGETKGECDLRLDLARYLKAAGDPEAARRELEKVRDQAAERGLGWIEIHAATELEKIPRQLAGIR